MPTSALALCAASLGVWFPVQSGIRPEPISAFDGQKWAGLILGEQKDPDLKSLFKAGKGSIRGEGMLVPTEGPTGVRVDALMDARGSKATLQAIRLEYQVNAPSLTELQDSLGEEPTFLWQKDRWQNWYLAAFPRRGVVGVIDSEGPRTQMRVFFLARPNLVTRAMGRFDREETEIVERPDPGEDWDRILVFGDVEVQVNQERTDRVPDDLTERGRDRLQDRIEDWVRSLRRGPVVYDRTESGRYLINVRIGRFNDRGESTVAFSSSLDTQTPYGPISVAASSSRKVTGRYLSVISDEVEDLMDQMDRNAKAKVSKLGPPPMSYRKDRALDVLMDDLTGMERKSGF